MYNIRSFFLILTVLFIPVFAGFNSNAQELVTNGNFETGDFTGWTQQQLTGEGAWFVYTGTFSPIDSDPILAPPEGTYAAVADQGEPDSNILYQDIDLPTGSTITCSAIVYYMNEADEIMAAATNAFTKSASSGVDVAGRVFVIGDGLSLDFPNQQYRIDIMDPNAPPFDTGNGVLLNLFQTEPGDPDSLGYTPINFDLTPFAGSTVRIRAAVAVTIGPLQGSIDAVSCIAEPRVEVPTLSEWGLIAMAGVLGIVGFMVMRRKRVTA